MQIPCFSGHQWSWGKKITQPWIEGREAKVKLPRKDNDHLCTWVVLIVTLLSLCILYIIYVPVVSNYKGTCFHVLEAFCISLSETRVHSLCLLFYWFVCFFSFICRPSIYQGNQPFDIWIANIFSQFSIVCVWVWVYYLFCATNKSIPGCFKDRDDPKLNKFLIFFKLFKKLW